MKIILLLVSLLLSGCAIHHHKTLGSGLSYDFIQQLKLNHTAVRPNLNIIGSLDNLKIVTTIQQMSVGKAHLIHLNSGKTFNEMLLQASNYSGYSCLNKCQDIVVKLDYIKFQEDYGMFGFNSANIALKASINIKGVKTIKTYKIETASSDDFSDRRGRFSLQLHFIEQVIAKIINDINSLG